MNKQSLGLCGVLAILLSQTVVALDLSEIRSRNAAIEAYLLEARAEQARAILAGETQNQAWRTQLIQLKGQVDDINVYATARQVQNYKLAIDASQQLTKELAGKYIKKVYPNARPDKPMEDPMLECFMDIFKALKKLENRPNKFQDIYPKLQEKMVEMDLLIASN